MQMDKHVTVVAVLHLVYSAMGFIGGLIIFALLTGIGSLVAHVPETHAGDAITAATILMVLGTIIAAALVFFAIPGTIGAIGLLKKKEWARILVLIVSFFDLLHIPLGTLLGGYSIWVLFHGETIALFRSGTAPVPAGGTQSQS